jgi:hypothetical protein
LAIAQKICYATFIELKQKPAEMDPTNTVASTVWQLNRKSKNRSSARRCILMVKCPKCGKENTLADKKIENQIFKISAYTCLNCATQFKLQSYRHFESFLLGEE